MFEVEVFRGFEHFRAELGDEVVFLVVGEVLIGDLVILGLRAANSLELLAFGNVYLQ